METILEAHIDRAFDKFTAWALRNAFDFPPELEIVMVSSFGAHKSDRLTI
jgi:kinetochore protein Mis12/MTW1